MNSLLSTGAGSKESLLSKENEDLKSQVKMMEKMLLDLQKEIKILKNEGKHLLSNPILNTETEEPKEYHTDEDELASETNWILKESKKKRLAKKAKTQDVIIPASKRVAESSPEVNTSPENPVKRVNKIEDNQKPRKIIPKLPPPINISNVDNIHTIRELLRMATNQEYKLLSLNNNVWKVNLLDSDSYRKLSNLLNEKGFQWYTYEDKNTRPTRIVARGLHQSCTPDEIVADLKEKNLKALEASNMYRTERSINSAGQSILTKKIIPLFTISFDNSEKTENIFNIQSIMGMRVRIEPLKKATGIIPQCKNCQAYNHTHKYCYKETRCVKCLGKHSTKDCNVARNTPAVCVNCGQNHPASYRGCEVAKMLQGMRNKASKKLPQTKQNLNAAQTQKVSANISFARMTKTGLPDATEPKVEINQAIVTIQNTLDTIVNRLSKMEENITAIKNRQDGLEKQQQSIIETNKKFQDEQNKKNELTNKNFSVLKHQLNMR